MSRPSSIDRLDPAIRATINRLRTDKGFTIEQIVAHLNTMGVDISRSAMGRHVKKLSEVTERIRESRAIAEGVASALSGKDEGQVMALSTELLQSGILRLLSASDEDGEDVVLSSKDAMQIGRALESASKASKINADRVLKIRAEAVKETAKKAGDEVEKALKIDAPGLSADTVAKIKRQVLGVAE